MNNLSFHEIVKLRHSCRGFLAIEVRKEIITSVLEEAQLSPSNCNTQPWNVHIVSGEKLKNLTAKFIHAFENEQFSPDFTFDTNHFKGRYKERQFMQGKLYHEGLGVSREDKQGRREANLLNYKFFNAPHVALLFMPSVGDNVRIASDIGMYAQTFLLSLTAHGLEGVPQTVLGFFADLIREHLGIVDDLKLMFGISFGYGDKEMNGYGIKMKRSPIAENVTFHN